MRPIRVTVACVLALTIVLCAAAASAETSRLTLVVDPSTGLDFESVRAAIATELSVDVVPANDPATANLRLRSEDGLRLTFASAGGRSAERALTRPTSDAVATEMVALLAGNLVRDEAGDLVERLRRARAERLARALDTADDKPKPAALSPPASPPSPSPTACSLAKRGVVGADFVPYVGSSSFEGGRQSTRSFSFNVLGGIAEGVHGGEIGGLFNIDRSFVCGGQLAGLFNFVGGPVTGVQLGGLGNVALGEVEGVQIGGAANVAGDVTGAQVGPVNLARDVRGAQIGVVNVAREADAPIGLVSVVTRGDTHLDAWHDTGMTLAGVMHGGRIIHNVYGAGARLYGGEPRAAVALGLGARLLRHKTTLDVDAIAQWLPGGSKQLTLVNQLRVVAGVPITGPFRLLVGLSGNAEVTDDPDEDPKPLFATVFGKRDETRVVLWPGVTVGIRGF